jgi:DNA adenine methylase
MANPFVKSVGGKRQLITELAARVPAKFNTYREPFVGGGALFFWLQAQGRITRAVLSDSNARLVRAYRGVRDDVEAVIAAVGKMRIDRESFLSVRANSPDDGTDVEMAAWYLYVNRCGFNGLYRENRKGVCNVPYGTPRSELVDPVALRESSKALQGVDIRHEDFASIEAELGDFVYFDPPYVPLSETARFTSYTAKGFGLPEQKQLHDIAANMRSRGVHVLLSNSDTEPVRNLYSDFDVATVKAKRVINSRVERRGKVSEVLIR